MLFLWCLLGGLICLFAPPRMTGRLQLAYLYVFHWPLKTGRSITLASRTAPTAATAGADYEQLRAERQRLGNQLANLQAQLKEAHKQIDELARLHVVPQWQRMAFQPADITVTNQSQTVLFINRGADDGIAVGQFVLGGQFSQGDYSVIGTVSDVVSQKAKVTLITDPTSKVGVTIGASDVARVMEGRRGGGGTIPLVPTTHTVRPGDKVLARKVPGLLDVPIVTAEVTQCRRDAENPSLWEITVQPVCDIAYLKTVAVIVSAPQAR
jgi:cell shape-determining protein MreC